MILDAGDVVLRPYVDRDRKALLSILGDPDLMKFVLDERALARDEAQTFIDGHFVIQDRPGFETVSLKATGEAIGFSGFRECRYLGEEDIEFGWVLGNEHHGRGYATALGERLIVHALESWRLARVLAACNPLNTASEHILRDKLHMRFEREVEPRPDFRRRVYAASLAWRR